VTVRLTFLSDAWLGRVETFHEAYIAVGHHPFSDLRFDVERALEVASRHSAMVRQPASSCCGIRGSAKRHVREWPVHL
jgi:hypothetical protein